ncbi:MAG TPA: glucoamylase family protein, partial [Anaerolineales bacterium]
PKLVAGSLAGQPRVYALARWLIEAENARLDLDRVMQFLRAYQSVTPLTMGELWALPIMFRLGAIQCLVAVVARLTQLELGHTLVIEIAPDADGGQAAEGDIVANTFFSLRALAAQDWNSFFEELSLVEQVLNQDPSGFFLGMDFETRDRYRKVVEALSLETGIDEQEVARQAIGLARAAPPSPPRTVHVGYYLLDRGRFELEKRLGYRPSGSKRISRWVFAHPTLVYLGSILLLVGLLAALLVGYTLAAGGKPLTAALVGLLSLVPALTVAVSLMNWIITKTVKPRVLPKMDYDDGLPEDCATLVAVPALLTGPDEVRSLLRQLEQHFLRNPDPRLVFALLTDLPDASQPHLPGDAALIQQIDQGVQALNARYGNGACLPFYLFHRERQWNPSEETWMGWERKRGKLHELNQLVLQARLGRLPKIDAGDSPDETGFSLIQGDLPALAQIRYVITLDADTILQRDTARQLVAALNHPLNHAELDPQTGAVLSGYTILQPRTEINPVRAGRSWFTRIFSGDTGLDLYTLAVSDVYQDFFGEGIYVGKGIYDVAAFEGSLAGRIPQNALLSHDLFEGVHGRVGLVSDIVLIEDYPAHYLTHMRRLHRWVRGDWQLLPWLLPRVPGEQNDLLPNRLSLISRWKILDNLRRSLVAPVLLVWFMAGWLWLPGPAWFWSLTGGLTLAVPFLSTLAGALGETLAGAASRQTLYALRDSALRWILALVFIPYEALLDLNAISRTLVRLWITRRQMLRWTTAAQAALRFGGETTSELTWRQMAAALVLATALSLLLALVRPRSLAGAAPFLATWIFSPQIAYWLSRPIQQKMVPLDDAQRLRLRRLARRTWAFFEQFIGPEDQWLPPDHYQESPLGTVAHHTSPTNIGLALLSGLAAYDLGYIDLLNLAARTRNTFDTLDKLERYRGHFLNWYDTRSLEPLPPRYISTVDSGNLAACLIALGQACRAMPAVSVLRWETWQGVLDIFDLLTELVENLVSAEAGPAAARLKAALARSSQQILDARETPQDWIAVLWRLSGPGWDELNRDLLDLVEAGSADLGVENLHQLRTYARQTRTRLDNALREIELLQPWLEAFQQTPDLFRRQDLPSELQAAWQALQAGLPPRVELGRLAEVAQTGRELLARLQESLGAADLPPDQIRPACDWAADLAERLDTAGMTAKTLLIGFSELSRQAETYVQAMDFTFLFNLHRQVFHIGYNLALEKLDSNYYDLLASEARIASLVAIAKGDVPQSHWLHLARPLTRVDGSPVLLSWSATMFEYLMPLLLVKSYPGTLLDQTAHVAADHQIAYGHEKKVPWGISESGYYRFDANSVYQYRAFGVPGLGYKRGLADDLVIAPYASLLALPLRPHAVLENMAALDRRQALGAYGYFEAVDFTSTRLPLGISHE